MNSPIPIICCFLLLAAPLQAVTVLPASKDGEIIGTAIGKALQHGFEQGFYQAQMEQDLQERQRAELEWERLILEQECLALARIVESRKHQTEQEWFREFHQDVMTTNAGARISSLQDTVDLSSFAAEPPAVQAAAGMLFLYCNSNEESAALAARLRPSDMGQSIKDFALKLLEDAAIRRHYTPAKKLIVSYHQDHKHYGQVVRWLHLAAEDGSADAMGALGRCYLFGTGTVANWVEAIKWISLAQDKGDILSQKLMQFLLNGSLISQRPEFLAGLEQANHWKILHGILVQP